MDVMISKEQLAQLRAETPACSEVLHFDNAGASLMPKPVTDYLHDYLRTEAHYGGYRTQAMRHEESEAFYSAAAKLLNCHSDEIAFCESATRAWDMVFYAFNFKPGDRVLTSLADYGSNFVAYQQQAKRLGVEIVIVPNDASGAVDVQQLQGLIDERVKLISISHIPTGGGLINPAQKIGDIAKAANIPYLLDACQSIGQLNVDVEAIGCDMACGTGRKYLRGPRGTGLLYVRKHWIDKLEPPMLDQHAADLIDAQSYRLRSDARRFEAWEQNVPGKGALAIAMNYAHEIGMVKIEQRIRALATDLRQQLNAIDGVRVMDEGHKQCGLVTFQCEPQSRSQCDAYAIKQALAQHDVHVSVSEGSGSLVNFQHRGIQRLVRASVHYFNTDDEVRRFADTIAQVIAVDSA
jgi:selenocysteine lyase/cysteine desulfurase